MTNGGDPVPHRERQRVGPGVWRSAHSRSRCGDTLSTVSRSAIDTANRQPLGFFITFRCHGTWLPGDERGWVDRRENAPGTPTHSKHPGLRSLTQAALSQRPILLDVDQRAVVDRTIREVCAYRGWTLHALNVRTNHVHLVLSAMTTPEQAMTTLKAWATRRLREASLVAAPAPNGEVARRLAAIGSRLRLHLQL